MIKGAEVMIRSPTIFYLILLIIYVCYLYYCCKNHVIIVPIFFENICAYTYIYLMALKSIDVDIMKGKKLDGNDYDIWHRKIQYILDD